MPIDPSRLPPGLSEALDSLRKDGPLEEIAENGALGGDLAQPDHDFYDALKESLEESVRRAGGRPPRRRASSTTPPRAGT